MTMIEKIKYILPLIGKISIINCIKYNIFKKHIGCFIAYKNGYYNIHKNAKIVFNKKCRFRFNRQREIDPFSGILSIDDGGQLIINEYFSIYTGGRVSIGKNAVLELGDGYFNHNVELYCKERIIIGKGVKISNNVIIRDNDAHEIMDEKYVSVKPIEIGNHVWVGTNVTILKGVKIGDGVIIGANSLVNKDIPAKCLAAGVPAKVIKENIEWK
jgi:acetyltransferase-like isoleucine patch superfamily enzyme